MKIEFRLNGKAMTVDVDADRHLLWVLRTELSMTGTKFGCGEEQCGACTVLLNGRAVRSCTLTMNQVKGADITTIEGLAKNGTLHPVQQAFAEHNALQCGFCTPGMILSAVALLSKNPHPSRAEILAGMDDNLCRCGAHNRIVKAIEAASARMAGAQ